MSLHANSQAIISHLRDTVGDLAYSIDQIILANQMSNDNVNGRKIIATSLLNVGVYFAAVDGSFSEDEAGFLADVNQYW